MENKKKRFIKPEAETVEFFNDDIITDSLTEENAFDWNNGGNRESWW